MEKPDTIVLLFDVDGVIVEPLAYKEGIVQTMKALCSMIGLENSDALAPTQEEIAYMESKGVHDIWDVCNMMFSLVLLSVFKTLSPNHNLKGNDAANCLREIKDLSSRIERPDYNAFVDQLLSTTSSAHPPDLALDYFSKEIDNLSWMNLLARFLKSTRSAYDSFGTQVFQNIILGSDEFERSYNLQSNYSGSSLLRSNDKIQISPESVLRLKQLQTNEHFKIAIYTARPSLAPPDVPLQAGFSPEAEIAIQLANLDAFPLVGMGMMEWLAAQHQERVEDLTKPNTTHALAAILAAMTQTNNSGILERAYKFDKSNTSSTLPRLHELDGKQIHIYVFEDTTSGIKPMIKNAEFLSLLGYRISVSPLGIATDENKVKSLSIYCKHVFADVNQALDFVLEASLGS